MILLKSQELKLQTQNYWNNFVYFHNTHSFMIINLNDDKYVEVQVVDKDTMSDRMGAGSA